MLRRSSAGGGVPLLVAGAALVGCGYPVDPDKWMPDFGIHGDHGAIAISAEAASGALTARYLSQDEADTAALTRCGAGCLIILRFEGAGSCGALAGGTNRVVGVASARPQSAADAAAIEQCRMNGGLDCIVKLDGCND